MSDINLYQQRPEHVTGQSPLHHAGLHELAGKGSKSAGIVLREHALLGHLILRGDASDAAFAGGVHKALGLELPGALSVVADGETSLQWLAPDESSRIRRIIFMILKPVKRAIEPRIMKINRIQVI